MSPENADDITSSDAVVKVFMFNSLLDVNRIASNSITHSRPTKQECPHYLDAPGLQLRYQSD